MTLGDRVVVMRGGVVQQVGDRQLLSNDAQANLSSPVSRLACR